MTILDLDSVVQALNRVLPKNSASIGLHEPEFGGNEWKYLKNCLDTGWVSSVGEYVPQFERQLTEYTGVRNAVAVVNGTAALYMCLRLMGVSQGDEVFVPSLTFIATANAVSYCNATPNFVDSNESTLGVDVEKLSDYLQDIAVVRGDAYFNKYTSARLKAVIAVHTYGHPVNMEPLYELCNQYKLVLIEDAAEALGSYYKGKHTGHWGQVSALSFNGNKIVTTGGGGAILTNDDRLAERARHLVTTARTQERWSFVHDAVGYNYRLPNINAALGCAQLEQLPNFLNQKRALAQKYEQQFQDVDGIRFYHEPQEARSNYWLNVLLLDEAHVNKRDSLLELTNHKGITTRPAWMLMHYLSMYKDCPKMDLSLSENLVSRIINIPSSAVLGAGYA